MYALVYSKHMQLRVNKQLIKSAILLIGLFDIINAEPRSLNEYSTGIETGDARSRPGRRIPTNNNTPPTGNIEPAAQIIITYPPERPDRLPRSLRTLYNRNTHDARVIIYTTTCILLASLKMNAFYFPEDVAYQIIMLTSSDGMKYIFIFIITDTIISSILSSL